MKKILTLSLMLMFVLGLAACDSTTDNTNTNSTDDTDDTGDLEETYTGLWVTDDVSNITLTGDTDSTTVAYTGIMGNGYKNVYQIFTESPTQNTWEVTFANTVNNDEREVPVVLCLEYTAGTATYSDVTLTYQAAEQTVTMTSGTGTIDENGDTRGAVNQIKLFIESGGNSSALGVLGSVDIVKSEFVDKEVVVEDTIVKANEATNYVVAGNINETTITYDNIAEDTYDNVYVEISDAGNQLFVPFTNGDDRDKSITLKLVYPSTTDADGVSVAVEQYYTFTLVANGTFTEGIMLDNEGLTKIEMFIESGSKTGDTALTGLSGTVTIGLIRLATVYDKVDLVGAWTVDSEETSFTITTLDDGTVQIDYTDAVKDSYKNAYYLLDTATASSKVYLTLANSDARDKDITFAITYTTGDDSYSGGTLAASSDGQLFNIEADDTREISCIKIFMETASGGPETAVSGTYIVADIKFAA